MQHHIWLLCVYAVLMRTAINLLCHCLSLCIICAETKCFSTGYGFTYSILLTLCYTYICYKYILSQGSMTVWILLFNYINKVLVTIASHFPEARRIELISGQLETLIAIVCPFLVNNIGCPCVTTNLGSPCFIITIFSPCLFITIGNLLLKSDSDLLKELTFAQTLVAPRKNLPSDARACMF